MEKVDDRPMTLNKEKSAKLLSRGELNGSSLTTTMGGTLNRAHPTSLASATPDVTDRFLRREEKNRKETSIFPKDRNLLVAQRLALKRQIGAFKGPSLRYEPVRSESYQMELATSPTLSEPNEPDLARGATAPTDVSLRFREKTILSHPISGENLVKFSEDKGNPSPCAYFLPRKSTREKNAPAFSFGTRCFVEKKGGSRTAWQKQWFAHSNPFTFKVDFNRENKWPTPFHYSAAANLGFQSTKLTFPAWSMSGRGENNGLVSIDENPSPDRYEISDAFRKLTGKSIPISFKSRHGGTQISTNPSIEKTPSPNEYENTKFFSNKISAPKFSFGKRFPVSLRQDPYVNVVPSSRT